MTALRAIGVGVVVASIASASIGTAAQTTNATDAIRSSAAGAIAGHVTDAHSKPIDSYSVIVFSTDRTKWFPDSRAVMVARPAQDGGFEVAGLAPGEYWVAAVDAIPVNQNLGEWGRPEALERLSTRATRVMLAARERYMTVLRLIRR
jgi:hypothetical protein